MVLANFYTCSIGKEVNSIVKKSLFSSKYLIIYNLFVFGLKNI